MLVALRTGQYSLIQRALRADWRLRSSTLEEAQQIMQLLQENARSGDPQMARVSIDVMRRLIGFETGLEHPTDSQQLYETATAMLLGFVRANESDKSIILDSVFLVRKLIQLFPASQFSVISRVVQQQERSITLLIGSMALVPQLIGFGLLDPSGAALIGQMQAFAEGIMARLNVSDWLSPLANGYLSYVDGESGLQLLQTEAYFERELQRFCARVTQKCGPVFTGPLWEEGAAIRRQAHKYIDVQLNPLKHPFLQLNPQQRERFLYLLPQFQDLAERGNQEAVQVIGALATLDPQLLGCLTKIIPSLLQKQIQPQTYEVLLEVCAYVTEKITLNAYFLQQGAKEFLDFVRCFQLVLKNERLGGCSQVGSSLIARVLGRLVQVRHKVNISPQFLLEILQYTHGVLGSLTQSRDFPSQVRALQQLRQGTVQVSQLNSLAGFVAPPIMLRPGRHLFLQTLQALEWLIDALTKPPRRPQEPLLLLSDVALDILAEAKLFSQSSLVKAVAGTLVERFVEVCSGNQRAFCIALIQAGLCDPQWRIRLATYQTLQENDHNFLDTNKLEPTPSDAKQRELSFPYVLVGQPAADPPLVLADPRFSGSLFQQLSDPVWQVRQSGYQYLIRLFQKLFSVELLQSGQGGTAQLLEPLDGAVERLAEEAAGVFKQKNSVLDEAQIAEAYKVVAYLERVAAVLRYAEVRYYREAFQYVALFLLTTYLCLAPFADWALREAKEFRAILREIAWL